MFNNYVQRWKQELLTLPKSFPLSAEVIAAVFQRTEGHPFFMTEVVRLLSTEQGAASRDISQPSRPVLPPTVRSVIEQRLQTVSPPCRRLLTVTAVIGREFRLQVLEAVTDQDERLRTASTPLGGNGPGEESKTKHSVLEVLDEALKAWLVVPVPHNLGRYNFTHALIQETLYEGIATIERLSLHRRIGEALEGHGKRT